MPRIRFKTLFGRMLFIQCTSCLLILLIAGSIVLLFLFNSFYSSAFSKSIDAYEQIDDPKFLLDNAETGIETIQKTDPSLFFQFISGDKVLKNIYLDPYWANFSGYRFDELNVSRIHKNANSSPTGIHSFFPKVGFRVSTVYFQIEGTDIILLIHSDMRSSVLVLNNLLKLILIVCIGASVIICLIDLYTAKKVLNPIVDMNHAVRCYSRGDFSQRLLVSGADEASQLAQSFNEMAEQLRNMDNSRKSFVANVSHELRSPLTSIKGFLEAMQDGTIPKEEHEGYLDIVLSETRRMASMVNDLLDLARIESGMITLKYDTFDINELIRRTLITFEALISEKELELDVRFAHDQCFVYADQGQISQVLRNLIDNAIKYSPEGRSLQVSTYTLRKEVYVVVKDTGVGIPAEDVPHIFDRFYKVEKAHTPSPQIGSGLGLSIVKKIMEAHEQSITVKSAKGKGTQFTFTLQKASILQIQNRGRKNEE